MAARFTGLPQAQKHGVDFAAQLSQCIRIGAAFALWQQRADTAVEAQDGLALHFGRVRGQNGGNDCIVQLLLQRFAVDFSGFEFTHGFRQAAFGTVVSGLFVDLAAAFVVHVFGDVQNLREQAAGQG